MLFIEKRAKLKLSKKMTALLLRSIQSAVKIHRILIFFLLQCRTNA
ncbi:5,10-methylenetetrahydrofolate reductase [Aggregatibacter aphrophilus NJ8700]|nr:5,10-methylenetetrahydrofolate reductase [Aggregatibacter aphrophilus NJ8700]